MTTPETDLPPGQILRVPKESVVGPIKVRAVENGFVISCYWGNGCERLQVATTAEQAVEIVAGLLGVERR